MNVIRQIPFLQDLPAQQQVIIVLIMTPILVWIVSAVIRTIILRFVLAPIRRYADTTETELDNRALDVIERPIRVLLIGVAIVVITSLLDFKGDIDEVADNLANSLIIASIFFFLYNIIDVIGVTTENLRNFTGIRIEDRLLPFLRVVFKVFVVVMGALIIVQEFGYSIAGLVASFGIVGLAISLAAQDTAANIIGFTSIVSDNPLHVGEFIIAGDVSGTVEEVGVRTTRIRKLDQSLVTVPNATLTGAAVTNWSRLTKRRLDFYIGLTYNTTASQMRAVIGDIRDMLKERDKVDPESVIVHFVEFGDSALQIRIIAYVLLEDWGEFTAEQENINLRIMEIVEAHKLSMAFPSTSLYIETPVPDELPDVVAIREPLPSIQRAIDKQEEQENATQEGTAEAKFQDNEAVSSEDDGGDAR